MSIGGPVNKTVTRRTNGVCVSLGEEIVEHVFSHSDSVVVVVVVVRSTKTGPDVTWNAMCLCVCAGCILGKSSCLANYFPPSPVELPPPALQPVFRMVVMASGHNWTTCHWPSPPPPFSHHHQQQHPHNERALL